MQNNLLIELPQIETPSLTYILIIGSICLGLLAVAITCFVFLKIQLKKDRYPLLALPKDAYSFSFNISEENAILEIIPNIDVKDFDCKLVFFNLEKPSVKFVKKPDSVNLIKNEPFKFEFSLNELTLLNPKFNQFPINSCKLIEPYGIFDEDALDNDKESLEKNNQNKEGSPLEQTTNKENI